MKRLLWNDIEAPQSDIDPLESKDSDAGGVEIQGYIPESLLIMNKFGSSSKISDGDSDACMGVGKPQRTLARIKRYTQHHQVSEFYIHAFFV